MGKNLKKNRTDVAPFQKKLHNAPMFRRKNFLGVLGMFYLLGIVSSAQAAAPTLTYRYRHFLFTLTASDMQQWQGEEEIWTYHGKEITPPASFLVDGDRVPPPPEGFARTTKITWDTDAIAATIAEKIASHIDQPAGSVEISRSQTGAILFRGIGFPGRTVDTKVAALLTVEALKQGATDIMLPVLETQPTVTVLSKELRDMGIRELVTIGESTFYGSTKNRIHNIKTGLNRFSGHLIARGETFSFVKVLGPVDATTGYRKELTIKGEKTLPDYGGGLCQVSTTAYRGVWEYGFPITQRKNHSYAVSYYAPQGTDATVYPPNVDIKFLNDSPGAILIQTAIDTEHLKASFLYYGTKDNRESDVIGPFVWGRTEAPPPRTEETTEIPPGTTRKVGEAVPGLHAAWFRTIRRDGQEKTEGVYSIYEARPLFTQIGVATLSTGSGSLTSAPESEAVLSD